MMYQRGSRLMAHIRRQRLKRLQRGPVVLAELHHLLMARYGWIPLREFRELPIPTVLGLLESIRKEAEEMERKMSDLDVSLKKLGKIPRMGYPKRRK